MTIHTTLLNSMPELVAIRRDLHEHPELGLEEVRTSDVIAGHLESYGYKVTRGLAKTGLVATLTNGTGSRSIGIRADIDALPIHEETGLAYASKTPARCMPAVMTATPPCCSARPRRLPSGAISTARCT